MSKEMTSRVPSSFQSNSFCTDQTKQTYEFNFVLPDRIAAGWHHVQIALGRREFAPIAIEVV